VVVLESRLLGSGQTGRSLGDMTSWHTGLFSSLERWTSRDQRQQVGYFQSIWDVFYTIFLLLILRESSYMWVQSPYILLLHWVDSCA
jgi:hypothetical protein